jgi:lysophospholipase
MTGGLDIRRSYPTDSTVGRFVLPDGWELRTFERPIADARGSILWLGGRGDIFEKYLESLDAWHRAGWHVGSFDWRGQGGSGRVLPDPWVGHIDDFATWIDDLAAFWRDWTARTPGPHVLMGHSMGGHLVLRALVERCVDPAAVVLSAPMLGFGGRTPAVIGNAAARLLGKLMPHRSAWKQNERPAPVNASRQAFLTHDLARYDDEMWWKDEVAGLALGPPSWGWMAAAARSYAVIDRAGAVEAVDVPVLVVATDGDLLVSPQAIHATVARLRRGELLMFDAGSAHEVLREADRYRDEAMARIAAFLDREVPRT